MAEHKTTVAEQPVGGVEHISRDRTTTVSEKEKRQRDEHAATSKSPDKVTENVEDDDRFQATDN